MPRGGGRGKKSHKGNRRHFTSEDEIKRQMEDEKIKKQQQGDKEGSGSDDEGATKKAGSDDSESESSEDEGTDQLKKGVASLIADEIENPNRVVQKTKKAENVDLSEPKPELSRREREEIEKQQAKLRYQKLHAQGKTTEAKSDLARLAIIRKQRDEAAKRREADAKAKDVAKPKQT
ncbi:PREDICTED: 28 kDa heat- and acid-stable phosphoprotein-like [Priapulus caudatus]|uniref:28 kDa heat- and acid-stable phosphoprotein-like n=1 Tax=Priapulus caudatus TaxID=37621 RepID=A0ABM1ERG4_PRICU|nr:PREDICTED: 28 kDa heat- and acid-stable phosphoprotein-like [Priapulus caudatus]